MKKEKDILSSGNLLKIVLNKLLHTYQFSPGFYYRMLPKFAYLVRSQRFCNFPLIWKHSCQIFFWVINFSRHHTVESIKIKLIGTFVLCQIKSFHMEEFADCWGRLLGRWEFRGEGQETVLLLWNKISDLFLKIRNVILK